MTAIGYSANFLWVLVLGLLGPLLPAMVRDLSITYTQAGLFFSLLSLGSFFGTLVGGTAADCWDRRRLFFVCTLLLAVGLFSMGAVRSYGGILLLIFGFSLFGSPIGAVGQSIVLDRHPEKRGVYLPLQGMFAALGSFVAPLLAAVSLRAGADWRLVFVEAGVLALILAAAAMKIRLPQKRLAEKQVPYRTILLDRTVQFSAVGICISVALDIGFSYWLAEYFTTRLGVEIALASAVTGIFLAGVMIGRLAAARLHGRVSDGRLLRIALSFALLALILFLCIPDPQIKVWLCLAYGLGIGPIFPLFLSLGTARFPERSGAVTGVLFSMMSLGGLVFPLLLGVLAQRTTIESAWLLNLGLGGALLAAVLIRDRGAAKRKRSFDGERAGS